MRKQAGIGVATRTASCQPGPLGGSRAFSGPLTNESPQSTETDRLVFAAPRLVSTIIDDRRPLHFPADGLPTKQERAERAPTTEASSSRTAREDGELPAGAIEPYWSPASPSHPIRRLDVSEFPIDSDALLYDAALQAVIHLNATAFHVWRSCDGRSIEELALSLTESFDVDLGAAIEHVIEIVARLSNSGLFALENSIEADA